MTTDCPDNSSVLQLDIITGRFGGVSSLLPTAIAPLAVVVSVWHNFTAGGKLANTPTQARN